MIQRLPSNDDPQRLQPEIEYAFAADSGLGSIAKHREGTTALAGESQPVGSKRLKELLKRCRHTPGGAPGGKETSTRAAGSHQSCSVWGPPTPRSHESIDIPPSLRALASATFTRLTQAENKRHRPTRLSTAPDFLFQGCSDRRPYRRVRSRVDRDTSHFRQRRPPPPFRRDHASLAGLGEYLHTYLRFIS